MDRKNKNTGLWISEDILNNNELSLQEKLFLAQIQALDNEAGCFASNSYFARLFDLSISRVSRIIKSLQTKGFISVDLIIKDGTKQIEKRIIRCISKIKESISIPKEVLPKHIGGIAKTQGVLQKRKGGIA